MPWLGRWTPVLVGIALALALGLGALWLRGALPPFEATPTGRAPGRSAQGPSSSHFELTAPLRAALAAQPHLWGPPVEAAALEGRVVLVTFFASWCLPCRAELEALRSLVARQGEGAVRVVAINHFETFDGLSDEARLQAFMRRLALPFPAIRGSDGLAQSFGGVERIPTLLVFDRAGRLVGAFRNLGPASALPEPEALERLVGALL